MNNTTFEMNTVIVTNDFNKTNLTNKTNDFNKTNEQQINNYDSISNDNTVINVNTNYSTVDSRKYLYYFLIITLCISFFILSCILIFIIFTIISLSRFNTKKLCPDSNLWYFVLASLLIFIFSLVNYKINNTSNKYIYNILCYLIMSTTIITWGTYELFYIKCVDKLSDTLLYNISVIYWIYNISFCGINIGLLLGLLLCSINIYHIISTLNY